MDARLASPAAAASATLAILLLHVLASPAPMAEAALGVNWGTITYHRLPPKTVARLLADNGIKKVKLFDVDSYTMETLAGTGIEVMIAVNNLLLEPMNDYPTAKAWVHANVTHYLKSTPKVNIKYVAVGNEPFLKDYKDRFTNTTFPALKNIQRALDEAGHGATVKATIPINGDIYYSPWYNPVPSAGRWRDDVASLMSEIVKFYNETGAPFTVNIYPFFSLYNDPNFPTDYAFFEGRAKPVVDGKLSYTNVFDANYDTLLAALRSDGCGDVPIIVGEVGWPTDGDWHANASIAERFYSGLTQKLANGSGTPQRPGLDIEVYLFGLFDEEAKSVLPGPFERSWGIFKSDGKAKFPVDLSGKGVVGKWPAEAVGVEYLEKRWCVVDAEKLKVKKNGSETLKANVDYACTHGAECMPLADGGSCRGLDEEIHASYAFNAYFQAVGQVPGSCGFDGLAKITTKNYTKGTCNFDVGFKTYSPDLVADVPVPAPAPAEDAEGSASSRHPSSTGDKATTPSGATSTMSKGAVGSAMLALLGAVLLLASY